MSAARDEIDLQAAAWLDSAKAQRLIKETLGFTTAEYTAYLGMLKDVREEQGAHAAAVIVLTDLEAETKALEELNAEWRLYDPSIYVPSAEELTETLEAQATAARRLADNIAGAVTNLERLLGIYDSDLATGLKLIDIREDIGGAESRLQNAQKNRDANGRWVGASRGAELEVKAARDLFDLKLKEAEAQGKLQENQLALIDGMGEQEQLQLAAVGNVELELAAYQSLVESGVDPLSAAMVLFQEQIAGSMQAIRDLINSDYGTLSLLWSFTQVGNDRNTSPFGVNPETGVGIGDQMPGTSTNVFNSFANGDEAELDALAQAAAAAAARAAADNNDIKPPLVTDPGN
jgi:hypothetical protein